MGGVVNRLVPIALLAAASPLAAAPPAMTRSEAAQLYGAAGFPIRADQPINACGRPANPNITFVDISGDGQPEALVIDNNAECYKGAGSYFAVLTKDGKSWRQTISGVGRISAQASRTRGWLDMVVTQGTCSRPYAYDGARYAPSGPCGGAAAPARPAPAPQAGMRPAPRPAPPPPAPEPAPPPPAAGGKMTAAEGDAIFRAAGATRIAGGWSLCADDPRKEPASIEIAGDLNGDGRLEAVVNQGGLFCYGNTGNGFVLVSRQANGQWAKVPGAESTGIASFLKTKGVGGWPDIEIGGPGFCFPVLRFNGKTYVLNRQEYEGKPCRR